MRGDATAGTAPWTDGDDGRRAAALRTLPQVSRAMETPAAQALLARFPRSRVLAAVRDRLDAVRQALLAGQARDAFCESRFFDHVRDSLERERLSGLRRVVNATGIVIHTNLGRAPLAPAAVDAVVQAARGYSNLEMDLDTGRRGSRGTAAQALLCALTGAEAALVVNNNAAAVLLALGALASGGEAVVSRGELVEIGGSFRIPDIIRQGGARLVEVGTTNRTRIADYAAAVGPDTRVLLRVHQSNYRVVGFTAAPALAELVALGRERGVPVMEDLGSGTLADVSGPGVPREPTVGESVAAGVDLVTFSGDKLLGGPQAGIVVGRADLVARLRRHPLMRAVRTDKLTLAALEATLRLHLDSERARAGIPVLAMLGQADGVLQARAARLAGMLEAERIGEVALAEGISRPGGGSLPEAEIPTRLVAVRPRSVGVDELARRLRGIEPAIVGRIAHDRFLMDVRTVHDDEVPEIVDAFHKVLA